MTNEKSDTKVKSEGTETSEDNQGTRLRSAVQCEQGAIDDMEIEAPDEYENSGDTTGLSYDQSSRNSPGTTSPPVELR